MAAAKRVRNQGAAKHPTTPAASQPVRRAAKQSASRRKLLDYPPPIKDEYLTKLFESG